MTIKIFCLFPLQLCLLAQADNVDLKVIQRIKAEAFQNSKVMEYAFFLTDVYGPRLLGSPSFKAAGDWSTDQLRAMGLANVHQEKLPPLGRGWSLEHFTISMLEPSYAPLIGAPLAWSSSTAGPLKGDAILLRFPQNPTAEDLSAFIRQYTGKLKGKIMLGDPPRPFQPEVSTAYHRLTDDELQLQETAANPEPRPVRRRPPPSPSAPGNSVPEIHSKLLKFLHDEGIVAWIVVNPISAGTGINQDGVMTVTHAIRDDPRDRRDLPPMMILASEHYNRIVRLLERAIPVRLELEITTQFQEEMPGAFNVIAELPGGKKKDEIVMIGAHLDSWIGGTGATDNAAGCAAVMEAMRILKALNLSLDRTVRVALWTAEEAVAMGSQAYVRVHLSDRSSPEYTKFCCYFNIDSGTGKARGIFTAGNDAVRPIFKSWLAPLEDLGVMIVSPRNGGQSDQGAFDAAGLPGFDILQDPLDYGTKTHHTNMDTYDHLQPSDLMHNAAVLASIAYQAAIRDALLPRKAARPN